MLFRRWTRLSIVVLAALMWLGVGVVAPVLMTLNPSEGPGDTVEASPADSFSLIQPVVVSQVPLVRVERGTLAFVDSSGAVLPPTDRAVVNGSAAIRIFNAVISVAPGSARSTPDANAAIVASAADSQPSAKPQSEQSPYEAALAAGHYEALSIRRTTLLLNLSGDGIEPISDVKAELSFRRRGAPTLKGTGLLRGKSVALDATAGTLISEKKISTVQKLPVRFSLKGEMVDAAFDGRALFDGTAVKFEGTGDLTVATGRGLARWLGAYWPAGGGLRDIFVRGQAEYARNTLSFEKASVRMDGNEGVGVLSVRFGQPRPMISGTLAYKAFDLTSYFAGGPIAISDSIWSSLSGGVLSVPLGLHLDADLRVSADRVSLGKIDLGPSASSIALKDGRLLADIGGLKFHGGEGGGHITADFTGFQPRVLVRGKLENVDGGPFTNALLGTPLLQGRVDIVADVSGTGTTLQSLIETLAGKLAVKSTSAGRLALDLRGMTAVAQSQELSGWQTAPKSPTAYEALDLRLVLRDGSFLTETAEVRTADAIWGATGIANVMADRIDLRVTQRPPNASAAHGPARSVLELKGRLTTPQIKAEALR